MQTNDIKINIPETKSIQPPQSKNPCRLFSRKLCGLMTLGVSAGLTYTTVYFQQNPNEIQAQTLGLFDTMTTRIVGGVIGFFALLTFCSGIVNLCSNTPDPEEKKSIKF